MAITPLTFILSTVLAVLVSLLVSVDGCTQKPQNRHGRGAEKRRVRILCEY